MGYKLAGMNVLGGVDIDKKMVALYRRNHAPKFSFDEGIIAFNEVARASGVRCDILDGSPPCTSFSTVGNRDADWGKEKKFREGQVSQRLDDLFFDFIRTAEILAPRVVIAENVRGIIIGKAKGYAKEIVRRFAAAGYVCKIFLLCASRFGVPQRRQRVFFIATRAADASDFFARLAFDEIPSETSFSSIDDGVDAKRRPLPKFLEEATVWSVMTGRPFKDYFASRTGENKAFSHYMAWGNRPLHTIDATGYHIHWTGRGQLTDNELRKAQTFPTDYDFAGIDAQYVLGMSVPPRMMKSVAQAVERALTS